VELTAGSGGGRRIQIQVRKRCGGYTGGVQADTRCLADYWGQTVRWKKKTLHHLKGETKQSFPEQIQMPLKLIGVNLI
jgi:hypothetical protein